MASPVMVGAGDGGGGEAPVAAPSAPPKGQAGGQRGAREVDAPEKDDDPEARPRKAPKRLPGLVGRQQGDEYWIKPGREELGAEEPEAGAGERQRDASGKFVASGEQSDKPGEVKPGEAPKQPVTPQPPGAKVKFAGKEYASMQDAENRQRSLEGMFTNMNKENKELRTAYGAWKQEAETRTARIAELEREIAELRSGGAGRTGRPAGTQAGQGQPAAEADPLDVANLMDDIDTGTFEQIAVHAGLDQAAKYLMESALKTITSKIVPAITAKFDQRVQPFEQTRESQQQQERLDNLVASVAELGNPSTGQPAFPELRDPQALTVIGQLWRESGLPPEHLFTHQGLMNAVAMYRMTRGMVAPAAAPVVQSPRAPLAPAPMSASVDGDGGGAPRPAEKVSPEAARILRALESTANFPDRKLGFVRHNREREI